MKAWGRTDQRTETKGGGNGPRNKQVEADLPLLMSPVRMGESSEEGDQLPFLGCLGSIGLGLGEWQAATDAAVRGTPLRSGSQGTAAVVRRAGAGAVGRFGRARRKGRMWAILG